MTVATRVKEVAAPPGIPSLVDSNDPASLMRLALEKGGGIDTVERLAVLMERAQQREAASEFAQAMADFQAECPPIGKTSSAKIQTKGGGSYSYKFAPLDEIARTVNPLLSKRGLSYSWDNTVTGNVLTCTCTVRHVNGHAITSSFTLPIDNPSAMNDQQKVGAALTFARRYALVSALGITTGEPDTDAASAQERITQEQADTLQQLLDSHGVNKERFLKWAGVAGLTEIPVRNYKAAVQAIEDRSREAGRK